MSDPAHLRLDVSGMTCAACAARVEGALRAVPGVSDANVNLVLKRADVAFDLDRTGADALIAAVTATGYGAARAGEGAIEPRQWGTAILAACALLTLPFLVQMGAMAAGLSHPRLPYAELALAGAVQTIGGARFYLGAWRALRALAPNMDVLVALGTSTAFFYSATKVFLSGGHHAEPLYFEASAVIITVVLFGKWLEERSTAATALVLRALMALKPERAHVLRGGIETEIAADAVAPGDQFIVRPGERFPADGIVITGESEADESLLTGESRMVAKPPGARVLAGAINGLGLLTCAAEAAGDNTVLSRILALVERLHSGKAPVQRLVDRVSGVFVPLVLVLAALTFAGWLIAGGNAEAAMSASVAVLVIACPCALGLATPAALVAGTGAAARAGILIRDLNVLESAHQIDTIVFDKTGTLTLGEPFLADAQAVNATPYELISIAASAQQGSEHPLGRAVIAEARKRGLGLAPVSSFRAVPGRGIEAMVRGKRVLIGNEALMAGEGIDLEALRPRALAMEERGHSPVFVAVDALPIGVLGFSDTPRESAGEAVARLQQAGYRILMLSGDAPAAAASIGRQIGIEEVRGGVEPGGKAEVLAALREGGHRVAMVGDGINDAPALTAADLGIAIGSGSAAAIGAASVTLMRSDPVLVLDALAIAQATRNKIRQNLFWAFIYNLIGLPLAVLGLLTPAIAGTAMALSSVSVVINALFLARWRPPPSPSLSDRPARPFLRWALGIIALIVLGPPLWVLVYGFLPPPGTPLMAIRAIAGTPVTQTWRDIGDISPALIEAVIASEDSKFCTHAGFDWDAIEDAMADNESGGRLRGASTISMQTAKNAFLWPDRSWLRKGFEAYFTVLSEALWSKRRIMTVYLNIAEWGDGIFGAEAAAQFHFGKPASQLTQGEAALLAALLPDPTGRRVRPLTPFMAGQAQTIRGRMAIVARDGLARCVLD